MQGGLDFFGETKNDIKMTSVVMWMLSSIDDTWGISRPIGLVVINDFLLRLGCSDT